ncbi:hypothetical protein PQR34_06355 [Paraburkholderia sediminicola]|uniref:hypothetical protein n=1 Tax=Paraburkholderia sediminicola TaxID=458836 RepID=UPI0038BBB425
MGFSDVVVKWENVLFFAFHAARFGFGFFWHCVEKCDLALRGLALEWLFLVFSLSCFDGFWVFYIFWVYLFYALIAPFLY